MPNEWLVRELLKELLYDYRCTSLTKIFRTPISSVFAYEPGTLLMLNKFKKHIIRTTEETKSTDKGITVWILNHRSLQPKIITGTIVIQVGRIT